jgi:hypothetical protein
MATDPTSYRQGEAKTLRDVIHELEESGSRGQFGAREGSIIRCFTCRQDFAPTDATVRTLRRLEGASDPDDMIAVLPLTCPKCGTEGTLVLAYGPEASLEDSEVLAALPGPDHPPEPDSVGGS